MTGPTSDNEVLAFWRGLDLPGLADVHVEFLPPRMLRRVWEQPQQPVPPRRADPSDQDVRVEIVRTPTQPMIYKWSDDERVNHLRDMGVRAFSALAYADQPGVAADLNAWTVDFASRTPGCIPSATFYPETGVNRYTRTALDAGARLFKIWFQAANISPAHALLDAVWGVLAEAGVPVIVHAGTDTDGTVHTGPDPIAAVLRRHPRLTAIIAGLGAPHYAESLALSETYERVCLDTSMAFTDYPPDRAPFPRACLPRLRALGLSGKVIFGTGFPNLPHPYAKQLSALAELDLGAEWLRAVCWTNAANLLQLS